MPLRTSPYFLCNYSPFGFLKRLLCLVASLLLTAFMGDLAAQSTLLGTTSRGGDGYGTIFKVDAEGTNFQVVNRFQPNCAGSNPRQNLVQASNGKLYGTTSSGGTGDGGVIFEYDILTATYTKRVDFNWPSQPGKMIEVNGKLWGMTTYGGDGTGKGGVIFAYDLQTGMYEKKYDFSQPTGNNPGGALVQAGDGKLYGMTNAGGAGNSGVIFRFEIETNTYTKLFDFGGPNGTFPSGSLIEASNGKLYGMTSSGGGVNGAGVIFEYAYITNVFTKKIDAGSSIGFRPMGEMIEVTAGKLYGTTLGPGINNDGTIFEYDFVSNIATIKHAFNRSTGGEPGGNLTLGSNGKLYGVTRKGGINDAGVIFEFNMSGAGTYSAKVNLLPQSGEYPLGSMILADNGKLYGTTYGGGLANAGTLFEYDYANDSYRRKIDFNTSISGANPGHVPMLASNGKVYGLTENGGIYTNGVLYEYDPATEVYAKKIDLCQTCSFGPMNSLTEASNGKLYGVTGWGSAPGMIFEYDYQTDTYVEKLSLPQAVHVSNGAMVEVANGKLYGSAHGFESMIFEYDYLANTFTKKFTLSGSSGISPLGSLLLASNGKLYGMTTSGGATGDGVIFEYDYVTNTYVKKIDLAEATTGSEPRGTLMQAANGKLYGMTTLGGANGRGVIFEYDYATNTFTKKVDLTTSTGSYPWGALAEVSAGKLFGMTEEGGASDKGTIFEYDYLTNVLTKKHDFTGLDGSGPRYGALLPICPAHPTVTIQFSVDVVCTDEMITLTATGAENYIWDNEVENGVPFSISQTTTFTVTGFDQNGCKAREKKTITVHSQPEKPVITIDYTNPSSPILTSSSGTTYTWYLKGEVIDESQSQTYEANVSGEYTVVTKNEHGCSSSPSDPAAIIIMSNSQESSGYTDELYPNPVSDYIQFRNLYHIDQYKVVDAVGREFTLPLQQVTDTCSLDVRTLPPGVYVLTIVRERNPSRLRFIKK